MIEHSSLLNPTCKFLNGSLEVDEDGNLFCTMLLSAG